MSIYEGDKIADLPIDPNVEQNPAHIELLSAVFSSKENVSQIANHFQETLVVTALFALIASKFTDRFVASATGDNSWTIFGAKIVAFAIIFYLINRRYHCTDIVDVEI